MANCGLRIADHPIEVVAGSRWIRDWVAAHFQPSDPASASVLRIHTESGYGRRFNSFETRISKTAQGTCYERSDYRLDIAPDHRECRVQVYDEFALRHAFLNLYSAFIVYHEWGLLVHSSCVVDDGKAYLFAGHSGSGKSTVASLSAPRPLLSDEASIVRIAQNGEVAVYDSPFRSESRSLNGLSKHPLAAIQLLHQSEHVNRTSLRSSIAFGKLLGNVFYWAHDPAETAKVVRLMEKLVKAVPVYDLHFQKNDTFWGLIS